MNYSLFKSVCINVGIVTGTILLGILGLYLISSDIAARTDAIVGYRSALAIRNTDLNTLTQLQENAATAMGYEVVFGRLLPVQDDLIGFPQNVATIGRSFNVDASIVFQGDPVPATAKAPGYIGFSLRAGGTSSALRAFLKNVESQSTQFIAALDSADVTVSDPSSQLTAAGRVFFR